MIGAFWNVSPVWKACGEPMSSRLNGSTVNIAIVLTFQRRPGRSRAAITQFCDSQASKSRNLRCW